MFIAYLKQNGGCDYTIACGETIWRLKAKTRDEAIEELKETIIGKMEPAPDYGYYEGYWDESIINKVILFNVSSEEDLEVHKWYKEAKEFANNARSKDIEAEEKAEYERLKAKFDR